MHRGNNRAWWRSSICAGLLVAGVCMAVMPAPAATKGGAPAEQRPARVRFLDSGSGETKAARQKRLKRECKGRPNAGACLGLTR